MSQSDFMSLQPCIKHINNMVNSLISHKNVVASKGSAGEDGISQVDTPRYKPCHVPIQHNNTNQNKILFSQNISTTNTSNRTTGAKPPTLPKSVPAF